MSALARQAFNVKFVTKTAEEIEKERIRKEEADGIPCNKTDIVNYLVKKGLEAVRNEK